MRTCLTLNFRIPLFISLFPYIRLLFMFSVEFNGPSYGSSECGKYDRGISGAGSSSQPPFSETIVAIPPTPALLYLYNLIHM
jgi:hypothetical protein